MATPTKILLTGFAPFGGMESNPSEQVVRLFSEEVIPGVEFTTMVLPVEYRRAMDIIREQVGRFDCIVMLGVARTRQEISIERVAINLMDAASKDNAGFRPCEEPVVYDGPTAYFSSVQVKMLAEAVKSTGIPCKVSNTAGTYVCNAVLYTALHTAAERKLPTRSVFVHVPTEKQLPIARMYDGVRIILEQLSNIR